MDLLCFFLSCVCYAFARNCLYVPCGHLLGKCWPLGSRLWCQTVSLSLFHWYPGSGVVLDCIDSWILHPYLLSYECSPWCPLSKLHKWFRSTKQWGCQSSRKDFLKWYLLNHWSKFKIISQNYSSWYPLPNLHKSFCSAKQKDHQSPR